ncbi:MAG: acyl-CoA thioesterase [Candidatus Omnitrophota bacterium]
MQNYAFSMEMEVRDYECDLQGIVNNAVYQNYLEHVRHEYLKYIGINFADYARKGINLVVTRAEMDYKSSLISGDRFVIGLKMERESKIRFAFYQDIYRLPDKKPVIKAKIIGTALNTNGRPSIPEELAKALCGN